MLCQRPVPEFGYLFVESSGDLAYLTSGDIGDAQALRQFLHLSGGDSLYKGFLDRPDESGFAALAFRYEKRDITATSDFGYEQIHGSHARIETSGPVTAAITGTDIAAFVLVCADPV